MGGNPISSRSVPVHKITSSVAKADSSWKKIWVEPACLGPKADQSSRSFRTVGLQLCAQRVSEVTMDGLQALYCFRLQVCLEVWDRSTNQPASCLGDLGQSLVKWNIIYIGVYSSSRRLEIMSSGFRNTMFLTLTCVRAQELWEQGGWPGLSFPIPLFARPWLALRFLWT